jgi:L-lactate dehydrogenase complex protein LldF
MTASEFRNRIRAAIADDQLQRALDDNARKRSTGRKAAFESLPDLAARRHAARSVRAETMERLHELLAQFTREAAANGMQVYRARDAAEALRLVIEIAEGAASGDSAVDPRRLLFAKSKSMISEEIELNSALEQRGHSVVETDLGEYIVQLRGEKPAHIITPAVHLQRNQVGTLFQEKLGLPYTEDIPTLTAAARRVLRQVFLTADVGISGVNFGVAETGGICIVTNEGNGRMVTTLPRVHIALMGMERLVPRLNDLALMLSLLPRSATGQKMSVYTQLLHGPRREGESDGALERHVVILDNGRSKLWNSDLREALYCIRCGACLNACPVFREIGGHAYVGQAGRAAPYPGPIGSVVSPGLIGLHEFGHLAQASSLCGACKDACPVEIDLPSMLTRVRAGSPEAERDGMAIGLSPGTRLALRAYTRIAAAPGLFAAMQRMAGLGARVLSPRSDWMRLPAWTGWGLSRDISRPAVKPFRDRWRALERGEANSPIGDPVISDAGESQAAKTVWKNPEAVDGGESDIALAERFAFELQALGGQVEQLSREDLPARVILELRSRGIDNVLCWDDVDGLSSDGLREAGITTTAESDPEIRIGVTGCTCAIAATGTLLIAGKRGQPLGASLLPETHIAIVHRGQMVSSLEEALCLPQIRGASASVLISGPSRTADIEMTLTIGVHGPKELLVFIVE